MKEKFTALRDQIVRAMLPAVPFDGWTLGTARAACTQQDLPANYVEALFPGGLCDVLAHFSDMIDRDMLDRLATAKTGQMRGHERVQAAIEARFSALEPYRDAIRLALAYWSVPPRSIRAGQIVWRTADRIWEFAGDNATDYNRYTKRGMLASILTTATLVWLKDRSEDHAVTRDFISNRIENVLEFGQILKRFKSR